MKLDLNHLEDWEDYMDDDEVVIKKFPRENKGDKNYKKQASIRKKRKEKMTAREQEENLSDTYEEV